MKQPLIPNGEGIDSSAPSLRGAKRRSNPSFSGDAPTERWIAAAASRPRDDEFERSKGKSLGIRLALSLGIWLAGAQGALAQSQPPNWDLSALMRQMAAVRSASANFTERKTLHVLNAPLIASGTLSYRAPDYLRKHTASPMPEDFILAHGVAAITGPDGQSHSFTLGAAPQIGGLVDGIRATLAGDTAALQRVYSVRLSGGPAGWQLTLRPRDAAAARFIAWIVIRGSHDRIDAIDTASGNGDHSEMGVVEDVSDGR